MAVEDGCGSLRSSSEKSGADRARGRVKIVDRELLDRKVRIPVEPPLSAVKRPTSG